MTQNRNRARPSTRASKRALVQRLSSRGVTLVELLIVVAMVGVMSALAIAGYRRYVDAGYAAEAKAMIQGIRGAEEVYKSEALVYLSPSGNLNDFYPNANPDGTKWNWAQPQDNRFSDPTKGWKLLHVTTDAPVRYGYALVAGVGGAVTSAPSLPKGFATPPTFPTPTPSQPWYVVVACGDNNKNSKYGMFMSTSFSSEIYYENESE